MTMRFLLCVLSCFCLCSGLAQIPSNPLGGEPTGQDWQQIDTDSVRIIFPASAAKQAQRVARLATYLWGHNNEAVGERMHKVNILLHNQTVVSNGFVTVGPLRSEFYLTSPQFNCTTDWLDMLTIHEYRHIKQFGNAKRGLTNAARRIFGSWGYGGFMATALPRWYFEGDGVVAETELTRSGRGRLPAFTMETRALVLDGIDYGYEKAAAGSLRDFVPDWYNLGYFMVGHIRQEYGAAVLAQAVNDAVRYKGLFFPFSRSLRKQTGLGTPELYREMRHNLDSLWQTPLAKSPQAPTVNSRPKRTVTDYTNPHYQDDNTLIVQKQGYDRIPTYYRLHTDGREERLTASGIIPRAPEADFSVAGDQLVWAERGFDERRALQTYSVIRRYNLRTRQKETVTRQSKYFSPQPNRVGNRMVAVEVLPEGTSRLVILEADGACERVLPNPDGYFLMYPIWSADESEIIVVGQRNQQHALYAVSLDNGSYTPLTPPAAYQLSQPTVRGEYIYYAAAYTGINNIFAVRTGETTVYQITNDRLGAFQPAVSPNGQRLAYSSFSRHGFDIRQMELDASRWTVYSVPTSAPLPTYATALAEQSGGSILEKMPARTFPVRKFSTLSGLLNLHSWTPYLEPPDVGATVYVDNTFGTLSATGDVLYNLNEDRWRWSAGLTYAQLYPEINLGYVDQGRAAVLINFQPGENDTTVYQNLYRQPWRERKIRTGLELPLNLTKGSTIQRLTLRSSYERTQVRLEPFDEPGDLLRDTITGPGAQATFVEYIQPPLADTELNGIDLEVRYQVFRRLAVQHLAPRLGWTSSVRLRRTVGGADYTGQNFLTRNIFYLPGLTRTHSLFFNVDYQHEALLNNYQFSNAFFYPRGYSSRLGSEAFRLGVNYSLPLWYPDVAIGPLAFVKRIKANAFYDHGRVKLGAPFRGNTQLNSVGVELRTDMRLIRLLDIDFGVRYSYLLNGALAPQGQVHQFDFLLISISG